MGALNALLDHRMTAALSSVLCLLALTLNYVAGQSKAPAPAGQNKLTIDDPGELITLSLPPGSTEAPADLFLADEAIVAAAAIPILALDRTAQGRVGLVTLLSH